jgi:predicted dehydrogenase
MARGISRRHLLQSGGAAGTVLVVGASAVRTYAANEKLRSALIGVSGRGGDHFGTCASENLVALSDADKGRLEGAQKRVPQAKIYTDYRRLFDAHKDLEMVFVAAPDHHHFLASMLAIQNGANVYTEKPLAYSVWEARKLAAFAKEKKVATQCGNQGRAAEGWRRLCEYVWSGALGDVTEVHCRTIHGGKGVSWAQGMDRPAESPVPANLDWEAWIGPAPMRPHHKGLHPFSWRGFQDFGTGALGDQCCHVMDAAFSALKLAEAESVEVSAECSAVNKETYPADALVTFKFPARGEQKSVTLKWFLGRQEMPRPKEMDEKGRLPEHGTILYAAKATVMMGQYSDGPRFIPPSRQKEIPEPPKTLPRNQGGHTGEFIRACKGGGTRPASHYGHSGPLTEIALLGNIAIRTGKTFTYKIKEGQVVNCPEAAALIKREPRKGWEFGYA